jgi:hypothetical protein
VGSFSLFYHTTIAIDQTAHVLRDCSVCEVIGATEPVLFWWPYGSLRRVQCHSGIIVCVYDVSNRLNTVECLLTQILFPNVSQTHLSLIYIHTQPAVNLVEKPQRRGEYIYAHAWGDSDTSMRS